MVFEMTQIGQGFVLFLGISLIPVTPAQFFPCLFSLINQGSKVSASYNTPPAFRIHVSPECKAVLDTFGGFYLEERGPVTLKVTFPFLSFLVLFHFS